MPSVLVLIFVLVGKVAGHGSLTRPVARTSTSMKKAGLCVGDHPEQAPQNNTCFWYSEGCIIGCTSCDMKCGHVKASGVLGKCCKTQIEPTLTDPKLRTFKNVFGILDVAMRYTPWRAPGFAPVHDPCGTAGGLLPGQHSIANPEIQGGVKQGMRGQDLPEVLGIKTQWAQGSIQEVAWGLNANHGGGYAYRLCSKKSGQNLTEACFQQHHLQFVGDKSWIQYSDDIANRTAIPAIRVSEGTNPPGSQWTKNPIPACGGLTGGGLHDHSCNKAQFHPPLTDWIKPHPKFAPVPGLYGYGQGHCVDPRTATDIACTGEEFDFWTDRFNFNIIDTVQVPSNLPEGQYVISFRWDCEQTPQIWTNCADLTITKPDAVLV